LVAQALLNVEKQREGTADGRQFFLTNPLVPANGGTPGRKFLAWYLVDKDGALLEARIEDQGIGCPPRRHLLTGAGMGSPGKSLLC
jgi:hypothetical protein